MAKPVTAHPAKFSDTILETLRARINPDWLILDPMAGTGLVHTLPGRTVGNEIEPEWACMSSPTTVGDALHLPFRDHVIDAVVTSCTFGNRMADSHVARDASKRITYTHTLGRKLHSNNSGQLQWGRKYQDFHGLAWLEVQRVLKRGGWFFLNVSNHIRKGEVQNVAEWHFELLHTLGFVLQEVVLVQTPRMRFGQNRDVRVEYERIGVFRNL